MSGCQQGLQCEGDHCGLFKISWPYWADAGKPTINGQSPEESDGENDINLPTCTFIHNIRYNAYLKDKGAIIQTKKKT